MTGIFDRAVAHLANARQRTQARAARIKKLEEEIAKTEMGKWLADERAALDAEKTAEEEARAELDGLAIERYNDSGDKRPHPAVQIKEYTTYSYDERKAFEWAKDNLPGALSLNRRVFDKTIPIIGAPEFVIPSVSPKVTVATDLSQYIEE